MRRVATFGGGRVKVYRDSDWQEYRIRVYRNGEAYQPADAFETDLEDALDTARAMLQTELVLEAEADEPMCYVVVLQPDADSFEILGVYDNLTAAEAAQAEEEHRSPGGGWINIHSHPLRSTFATKGT